ncbi:MAG: tRNA 2-selenouridine(34) synthase MnmH [Ignavibacteria bacterium]|nr:tRNA 2-selenouridine(34) synthase MnmH [Ignavibacteria bacterium]
MEFKTDKDLFNYVRSFPPDSVQSLKDIFSRYILREVDITYLLEVIYKKDNILLIDSRTEKEYEETSIPSSLNFPVLNNNERHNVGLVFRKYSSTAAVKLAIEYAEPKTEKLKDFLSSNKAGKKEIFVYCWRGGGRSKYLSKLIYDLGYECKTLAGGIKSYRRAVNKFWNKNVFPYSLTEITGLTGSGKTEIIRLISKSYPTIDLELAARHYSSLFGYVPYLIQDVPAVKNQSAFENNIYAQIISGINSHNFKNLFFIESESKKVGDFLIPAILFNKLNSSHCILVESSFESRVERIVNDYFGNDLRGLEPMLTVFREKEKFFRKELSNKIYEITLFHLTNANVSEFTEIMLKEYYDKKYKVKPKTPLFKINTDNTSESLNQIKNYYENINGKE